MQTITTKKDNRHSLSQLRKIIDVAYYNYEKECALIESTQLITFSELIERDNFPFSNKQRSLSQL